LKQILKKKAILNVPSKVIFKKWVL